MSRIDMANSASVAPDLTENAGSEITSRANRLALGSALLSQTRTTLPKSASRWTHVPLLFASLAYPASSHALAVAEDASSKADFSSDSYSRHQIRLVETAEIGSAGDTTGISNWRVSRVQTEEVSSAGLFAIAERLEDLSDGWNGPESFAPNGYVKRDVRYLAAHLDHELREPEVEVDNDGSVTLRWENDERTVACTINGNGRVIGTTFPRAEGFPRAPSLADAAAVLDLLANVEVRSALT